MAGLSAMGAIEVDGEKQYAIYTWVPSESVDHVRHAMKVTARVLRMRDQIIESRACDDES